MLCVRLFAVLVAWLPLPLLATSLDAPEVTFRVRIDGPALAAVDDGSVNGRIVVYLIDMESRVADRDPADGPFWTDPQPLFGMDVADHAADDPIVVGPDVQFPHAFPEALSELPAGRYKAQAVLDRSRIESSWSREPGNLFGDPVEMVVPEVGELAVELTLDHVTDQSEFPRHPELTEVSIESRLLSEFRGEKVLLNAGVLRPTDYDPEKKYAVIYEVPGFGGRHTEVARYVFRNAGDWPELRKRAFIVVLDPESPNGHTLFCDSRVNGPWGRALIEELIPAVEAEFPGIVRASWARVITGHSSGGWSSLWLGLNYPETFGAVWSSGPDPVDFRKFELINIYEQENAFQDNAGEPIPSCRYPFGKEGNYVETLTVEGEDGGEGVLGPDNISGQQWDSWQACWGNPDPENPAVAKPLYDAKTGRLDHEEARAYEAYDVRLKLAREPEKYVPLFHERIRIVCGELDNYYLNEAVTLLKQELEGHAFNSLVPTPGYIKLVPNADHGEGLFRSEEMQAWPGEMLRHLREHGLE